MRWLGNYLLEVLRGPWPQIYFIRHAHGFHQIGYEMVERGLAKSAREGLGVDIPNHLIPLSPFGRFQAEETRKKIEIEPDCIYASQLLRAIQTAQIIFPGRKIRIDPRLNEKDFGAAHLRSREELEELFPEQMERYIRDGKYFASKAPGGENYVNQYVRRHSIVDTYRRDWAGKIIVVFDHSADMMTNRQLFEHHAHDKLMELAKNESIPNCGILAYNWPNGFGGWQRGKFRLKLARPPYRLWLAEEEQVFAFWNQALIELEELRKKFA